MGKTKLTMYFLVEGKTELWYLERLAELITSASDQYWANFRIGTPVTPESFVRRQRPPAKSVIYALLDFESTDPAHEQRFLRTLHELRVCGTKHDVNFCLGYANYAFELWLILHKMPFLRPVCHRKDYLKTINDAFGTSFRSMPNYKKEKNFRRLLRTLDLRDVFAAMDRAQRLRERNEREHYPLLRYDGFQYYRHDPSLSVDLVIADVLERAGISALAAGPVQH